MRFVTTNFELDSYRELEEKVVRVLEKYGKKYDIGLPIVMGNVYFVEIHFYGDISDIGTKGVWIRFTTCDKDLVKVILEFKAVLWSEEEEEKKPELIKELEEVVRECFEEYEGVWDINVYRVEEVTGRAQEDDEENLWRG